MSIKNLINNAPIEPGIYQMLDKDGAILYIGKAKALRNRLKNYMGNKLTGKTLLMVRQIETIEWVITKNESEALILESRLIRKHKPKYNVLLKDDKSFPYIMVKNDHDFPQVTKYRGKLNQEKNKYFGPFASAGEVNNALKFLQKNFKLRNCTDNYFKARKRPCLQYQIGRCSAPCVSKISKEEYASSIKQATMFLSGDSKKLHEKLAKEMDILSQTMEYEKAAEIRDRIRNLSYIQLKNETIGNEALDLDAIAVCEKLDIYAVTISFYRKGQFYGQKTYYPEGEAKNIGEVLSYFIGQFYQNTKAPKEIIINAQIDDTELLENAISQIQDSKVKIINPIKGVKKSLIVYTLEAGEKALESKIKNQSAKDDILEEIVELFDLDQIPERIEIYDNSHIMGTSAVGAMVVAGREGFLKNEYRIYNVENKIGDDYAMLAEVLTRRMNKIKEGKSTAPNLMIIDGGKGQLSTAKKVMDKMDLDLNMVAMSKGVDRNAGKEIFHMINREEFTLDRNNKAMKYLQILRDEAHNFAINSHRKKRSKTIYHSSLDKIPNVGSTRKKALLNYFGGIEEIKAATIEELMKVEGISRRVAEVIYESLKAIS